MNEAIIWAKADRELPFVADVADSRGFRRQIVSQVARWTRSGHEPDLQSPEDVKLRDQWAIFTRYRVLLQRLRAEDHDGFARWAARRLAEDGPEGLFLPSTIVVIEPDSSRNTILALTGLQARADSILATLTCDVDPSRSEVFEPIQPLRERFLSWDFEESRLAADTTGPAGLETTTRRLFSSSRTQSLAGNDLDGLIISGAPRGEGQALAVAKRVKVLLDDGAAPDEILVVFRRLSESAMLIRDTLQAWEIPVELDAPRSLETEPVISALRLASGLSASGWDTKAIVRLLRNGQLHPDWTSKNSSLAMAEAASAVIATNVFRGKQPILTALRRDSEPESGQTREQSRRRRRSERALRAIPIVERLISAVESASKPATWVVQSARLRNLATELGLAISSSGQEALEHLWLMLDDHGIALDGLGRGLEVRPWSEFTALWTRITAECSIPAAAAPADVVRLVTSASIVGGSCRHLILGDLAEGTFPDPDELESTDRGFPLEMSRFLRLVGSAEASLTLVYPTTDEKGSNLLAAGFLDEIKGLFLPDVWNRAASEVRRLEPALPDDSWAGSPGLARVRALSLACERNEMAPLQRLAREEFHRPALLGAAEALDVAHARVRSRDFGPFDGLLRDPALIARIAEDFGPGRPAFSPSQLETLALCPFQFYLRFVLRLEPTEDRDELDEDFLTRGNVIHRALESLHSRLRDAFEASSTFDDAVARGIGPAISWELGREASPESAVAVGLRTLVAARLERTGKLYAEQFARYAQKEGISAEAGLFEVKFGAEDQPPLVIGEGDSAVRLQGSIDRIDFLTGPDGSREFRVIDYKTGPTPAVGDLHSGIALQLPLYSLAAERLRIADALPADFGYWALADKGYRPASLPKAANGSREAWPSYARRLEAFIMELAGHLRKAEFPVAPRSEDCTRHCEYSQACRIKQIRAVNKTWAEAPMLEPGR